MSINYGEDIGRLWDAEISKSKVKISYQQVKNYLPDPTLTPALKYVISKNINWGATIVERITTGTPVPGVNNSFDSFLAQNIPVPKTCSSINFQINNVSAGVGGIFVAGYMKEEPKDDGSNISLANFFLV